MVVHRDHRDYAGHRNHDQRHRGDQSHRCLAHDHQVRHHSDHDDQRHRRDRRLLASDREYTGDHGRRDPEAALFELGDHARHRGHEPAFLGEQQHAERPCTRDVQGRSSGARRRVIKNDDRINDVEREERAAVSPAPSSRDATLA